MTIEEIWMDYTSTEKETFQRCCRKLLKNTFIVRDKDEENKKMYYFVSRNPDIFTMYLGYMDFDITVDRENGVIMLCNYGASGESGKIQANRLQLKKVESIVLCCLWNLYADRVRTGTLSRGLFISMADLNFELERYDLRETIEKTKMQAILKLFSRYSLIDLEGRPGDPDCQIRLYPSLAFALDMDEFARFAKKVEDRMLKKEEDMEEETNDPE